jgi:protein SCO1/2
MKRLQKTSSITIVLLVLLVLLSAVSCNKSTVQKPGPEVSQSSGKRYHLKGKVVSIDKQGKMVNVDSEAIPGFMEAMTMPYQVKPESELDKLSPGDAVTADVVVEDERAWLENVAVTGHSATPAAKTKVKGVGQ